MSDLVLMPDMSIMDPVEALKEQAREFIGNARSPATLRARKSDWACFTRFCQRHNVSPLPAMPETVALYITGMASTHAVATIEHRLSTISQAHQAAEWESPTRSHLVRETWRGIRRTLGTAQTGKAAIHPPQLRAMLATTGQDALGFRDRAVLLFGFYSAMRRSEIVALNVADVEVHANGLIVNIRRSKTDQEGQGTLIGVPFAKDPALCPVLAVDAWLHFSGIEGGPLFRPVGRWGHIQPTRLAGRGVASIVQARAKQIGLDPTKYGGHSLRSGFITAAIESGAREVDVMRHSRHKSLPVMRRYVRRSSLWEANAAQTVDL